MAKDYVSGSVLELGCGTGRITIPIWQNAIDIVGIDISPKMIEVAKANFQKNPQNLDIPRLKKTR